MPPKYLYRPQNEAEAECMQKAGYKWLADHAPHRLTDLARKNEQIASIAAELAEALEYVLMQVHDVALDQGSAREALATYRKVMGE